MAEQGSIVKVYKNGIQGTFQRFKQKTIRGVLNQYRKLWKDGGPFVGLFFKDYHEADYIVIVNDKIYKEFTPAQFFSEISV